MAFFKKRTAVRHQLTTHPGNPEAWVELYTEPTVAEIEKVYTTDNANPITQGVIMLSSLIASWGLTEEDGSVAPVTAENVRRLSVQDINELIELVTMPDESPLSQQKKTS